MARLVIALLLLFSGILAGCSKPEQPEYEIPDIPASDRSQPRTPPPPQG